ncbi:Transcriptional activator HlyU [BD1-7 clade bacterium]|uniref:Transcriptional activator HlyU n=1 Tax=BD1-7 clade bacterium TaxID=2029982 RepID=A0A5S9PBR6_9GAMM|nr:Transcriptional activator HlyU [BD1-7 clade bacterium]CAA0101223.1 Transcriptional activator HlyU [BD1-7 clade bacterium]CAA0102097.1 Transcriptional activator HlyU [BD1-7 clade bacterium]
MQSSEKDLSAIAEKAELAASFLKSLANPNRLMVLCHLLEGELSVGELNQRVPLSQSALSQHLLVLRDAEMVATRRESQVIYYSLKDERVKAILATLYDAFCA